MSIGIMDADISKYIWVPFNLEAMKISAYYKRNGEIVILSPTLSPERHEHFYYIKDYNDKEFPLGLTSYNNVEYRGLAFTNNVYAPLPEDIEIMQPDTSLYSRMESTIIGNGSQEKKKIFHNMTNAEHCRLSLDGKTIWPKYEKQFKSLWDSRNLMLHDYDLGQVENSFEVVKDILAHARNDGWATRLGMKFPIQISNGIDLLKWSSLKSNSIFYSLKYSGVIDDESFLEWVGKCREKAIYSQIEYYITPSWYDPNHFIEVLLPKILRQVIISRSYRIFFSLIYDDDFFPDKRWCNVLRLFNYYHNSYAGLPISAYYKMITDDTMFNFAAATNTPSAKSRFKWYRGDALTTAEIREIFVFVRENHPQLFTDFYECSARTLGGKL